MTGAAKVDLNYAYGVGQNNGQVTSVASGVDPVGFNATYTYDALNQLTSVTGLAGANHDQTDPMTNRLVSAGICYDPNGNMTGIVNGCDNAYGYDIQNRLVRVALTHINAGDTSAEVYSYTADNKRVATARPNRTTQEVIYVYGAQGEIARLCTMQFVTSTPACGDPPDVKFAGRVILRNGQAVATDRLGSVLGDAFSVSSPSRKIYEPYGEQLNAAGSPAFPGGTGSATYFGDQTTGLNYAMNRFYNSTYGRFMSADPYRASAGAEDPASWNRCSYTRNDPINSYDPSGMCDQATTYGTAANGALNVAGSVQCPPGGFGGSGTQATPGPAHSLAEYDDRHPPNSPPVGLELRGIALALKARVSSTTGYNDCQALADFADAASSNGGSATQLSRAFGILTPVIFFGDVGGISSVSKPVFLNSGEPGGFQDPLQNTINDDPKAGQNGDQGHHFAAFFQFGYLYGSGALGAAAAYAYEFGQGLANGGTNYGDIKLGVLASQIGADLRNKILYAGEVGDRIRALCK